MSTRADGMRTIPCLLCTATYIYDPAVPGLREHGMETMLQHYFRDHGGTQDANGKEGE